MRFAWAGNIIFSVGGSELQPDNLTSRRKLSKSNATQSSSPRNIRMETIDEAHYRTGSGGAHFAPLTRSVGDASGAEGVSTGNPANLDGNRSPHDTTSDKEDKGGEDQNDQTVESTAASALSENELRNRLVKRVEKKGSYR